MEILHEIWLFNHVLTFLNDDPKAQIKDDFQWTLSPRKTINFSKQFIKNNPIVQL